MHYARQVRAEHLGSGITSLPTAVHAAAARSDFPSSLIALLRQVEGLRLQLPAAKLPGGGEVTERGLLGDRVYALIDTLDGKVVSAKNPRKWAGLFEFLRRAPSRRRDIALCADHDAGRQRGLQ